MREDYTSVSVQAVIDCNTESAPTELRNSEAEIGVRAVRVGPFGLARFALRPGLPVPRAPEVGRSEVTNETSLNLASEQRTPWWTPPQRARARGGPAAGCPDPSGERGPSPPRRPGPRNASDPDGRVWVVPGRGPGARRGGCGGGSVTSRISSPVCRSHPVRTSTGYVKRFFEKNGPPDTSTTRAGADAVGCSPRAPPRSSDVGKTLASKSLDLQLHLVAHSLSSIIGSSSALRRVTFVLARGFFLCLV